MSKRLFRPLALVLLPIVAACNRSPVSAACLGVISPAIRVQVLDSVTLRPAAGGASGWVREGTYQDSLKVIGWTGPAMADSMAIEMAAAYERPGTYVVEITRPGYEDWRREGVRADDGICGVETVGLTARLRPLAELPRNGE